mmetsp:Transcript_139054/g.245689  ORF Transcript_139054/g.245689 Transcript_139054/m.245689 type:complete len:233 (-) Transcript_139054:78-776(-)
MRLHRERGLVHGNIWIQRFRKRARKSSITANIWVYADHLDEIQLVQKLVSQDARENSNLNKKQRLLRLSSSIVEIPQELGKDLPAHTQIVAEDVTRRGTNQRRLRMAIMHSKLLFPLFRAAPCCVHYTPCGQGVCQPKPVRLPPDVALEPKLQSVCSECCNAPCWWQRYLDQVSAFGWRALCTCLLSEGPEHLVSQLGELPAHHATSRYVFMFTHRTLPDLCHSKSSLPTPA